MLITNNPAAACCDSCSKGHTCAGMGATDTDSNWLRNLLPIPVDGNWIQPLGTVAIAAVAAYLAYKMFFGKRANNRRKELTAARRDYQAKVAEIREKWAY